MKRLLSLLAAVMLIFSGCQNTPVYPTQPDVTTLQTTQPKETEPEVTQPEITEPEITAPEVTQPVFDALAMAQEMRVEELVGQMFLAGFPGKDAAVRQLESYPAGGYVLFGSDTKNETPDSLRQMIEDCQNQSKVPLLFAVDEEGGTVTRISCYEQYRSEKFPSPRNLYARGGLDAILQAEKEKANLLTGLGISVCLGPVCDITTNPDAFMYSRSLGLSPEETGEIIAAMVQCADGNGLGNVLKHFPGYGENEDTHIGIAIDDRSLQTLQNADLVPFRYGIDAGCDAIMISHTVINAIDPYFPASVSPAVVYYIRNEMGFDGVIITDDLRMQAITDKYGDGDAAVLALVAGVDMFCTTAFETQYQAVLQAVKAGNVPLSQVQESVARILQWKYDLGLLEFPQLTENS